MYNNIEVINSGIFKYRKQVQINIVHTDNHNQKNIIGYEK